MSRPRLPGTVHTVNIKLYLREGEDDDLLRWFEMLPRGARAAALKTALRTGQALRQAAPLPGGPSEDDGMDDLLDQLLF